MAAALIITCRSIFGVKCAELAGAQRADINQHLLQIQLIFSQVTFNIGAPDPFAPTGDVVTTHLLARLQVRVMAQEIDASAA